ncbi:MAG: amidohydrolase family protein [Desulfomicrobium escambiense]|nr:amidohydrolase family protein [Desulfomicrobium escambiense]
MPALSTDAPVQPFDPFLQIAGAAEHPVASESLSVHEALRAYSQAGAYGAFEEGDQGTLEVGKFADFAPLDRDPFETPPAGASQDTDPGNLDRRPAPGAPRKPCSDSWPMR